MHPRARALFDGFGAQWLRVNELERQVFDPDLFPQMTPALREAMMTSAPLVSSASAIMRPMPREPPVTSTFLLANSMSRL